MADRTHRRLEDVLVEWIDRAVAERARYDAQSPMASFLGGCMGGGAAALLGLMIGRAVERG